MARASSILYAGDAVASKGSVDAYPHSSRYPVSSLLFIVIHRPGPPSLDIVTLLFFVDIIHFFAW